MKTLIDRIVASTCSSGDCLQSKLCKHSTSCGSRSPLNCSKRSIREPEHPELLNVALEVALMPFEDDEWEAAELYAKARNRLRALFGFGEI